MKSQRITPAYAGKSPRKHMAKQKKKDHPRICGEKDNVTAAEHADLGSPPHMRGKD